MTIKIFTIVITIMILASVAYAQSGYRFYRPPLQTLRQAAIAKCFQNAPWVDNGWLDQCIINAKSNYR